VAHAPQMLVLLRHAKSAWPQGVPDHERPLSGRGRRNASRVGSWLREAGWAPELVICSTALRARETWQRAESQLGAASRTSFDPRVYLGSARDLLAVIRETPAGCRRLLLVGHNPAVHDLGLMLAGVVPQPAAQPLPRPAPGPLPQPAAEPLARPCAGAGPARPPLAPAALERMRAKFPTAAAAVFEVTGAWGKLAPATARLVSFVAPPDLHPHG
jgi:phosphohistidine phosphatase